MDQDTETTSKSLSTLKKNTRGSLKSISQQSLTLKLSLACKPVFFLYLEQL